MEKVQFLSTEAVANPQNPVFQEIHKAEFRKNQNKQANQTKNKT